MWTWEHRTPSGMRFALNAWKWEYQYTRAHAETQYKHAYNIYIIIQFAIIQLVAHDCWIVHKYNVCVWHALVQTKEWSWLAWKCLILQPQEPNSSPYPYPVCLILSSVQYCYHCTLLVCMQTLVFSGRDRPQEFLSRMVDIRVSWPVCMQLVSVVGGDSHHIWKWD